MDTMEHQNDKLGSLRYVRKEKEVIRFSQTKEKPTAPFVSFISLFLPTPAELPSRSWRPALSSGLATGRGAPRSQAEGEGAPGRLLTKGASSC